MGDDDVVGGGVEDPFFIKVLCIFGPSLNLNRRLFIIVSLLSTVYFNIPSIKSQVEQLHVGWPALLPVTTFSLRSFITSRANSLKA